jgi:hypothetical protein
MSLNTISIAGNLGDDPSVHYSGNTAFVLVITHILNPPEWWFLRRQQIFPC